MLLVVEIFARGRGARKSQRIRLAGFRPRVRVPAINGGRINDAQDGDRGGRGSGRHRLFDV
jgi:hypothetical protein